MTKTLFGVYGAGGHGREVMAIARIQLQQQGIEPASLVFVDDAPRANTINGQRVVNLDEFVADSTRERRVALAISNGQLREHLAFRCAAKDIAFWEVRAPNAVVLDNVSISEGAILSPFSMLTSNIRVGRHFHANMYSYVAHDCVIGDFVTFGPGAKCNGNVIIEDHAYIGSGAILKNGKPDSPLVIGRDAVVGMGAVVTHNVAVGETVVGNPARSIKTQV